MVKLLSAVTLLVLAAVAYTNAQTIAWDDLRVTFSFSTPDRGFFKLPRTVDDALTESWTQPSEIDDLVYDVLCPEMDPSVCVVYDKLTREVNGIQISFLVSDTASPYDFNMHPMFVRGLRFGYDVYTVTMYTVKPAGATAAGSKLETGAGLWMEIGPQGVPFFEIPRFEAGMAATKFTLENCVEKMGVHYYYNISRTLPCEEFEPMFALYKNGEMHGFGIQTWGSPTQLGSRDWFEPVPAAAVRPTVPDCPDCLVEWSRLYELMSLHVYFIDEPWLITCE